MKGLARRALFRTPPAVNEPSIASLGLGEAIRHRVSLARTATAVFVDKPMAGPIRYTVNTPWKIGVHTTEGTGLPTYQGGSVAPQVTVDIKGRRAYRHANYLVYAGKAFKHPAGTPATNTTRVVQVEVIGYCDDHHITSPYHVSNWTDADYTYLASVLAKIAADVGCPLRSSVTWKGYGLGVAGKSSAGFNNGVRLSRSAFFNYSGVLGHEHVPDNDHGDPGHPDVSKMLASSPPPPPPTPKGKKLMIIGTVKNDNRSFVGDGVTCRWIQGPTYYNALVAAGAYVHPVELDSYAGLYAILGRRDPLSDPGTSKVSPPIPAGQTDPALYVGYHPAAVQKASPAENG